MAEIGNLMPEHLKRFQATLERMERTLDEHAGRLANLEGGQAAIVRHLAHFSAADAAQQTAIDTMNFNTTIAGNGRLPRIERRLALAD